jgi:hypothetical protein
MKRATGLILFLLLNYSFVFSQRDGMNMLSLRGENFKEEIITVLACADNCLVIDKESGFIAFTLTGKIGERNILVTGETPVLKGTKKIKVDKDGDPSSHQKLTIEIFGSNPAVDKDTYEIQGESDEAIITIQRYDELKGELVGNFSVKYIDNTTGLKKLVASCRFFIQEK